MSKVSMLWFRRLFVFLLVVSANILWAASTITTTVVTASPNPLLTKQIGQPRQNVQFTATVTGNSPSGVVDFYDENDSSLGQAPVVNGLAVLTKTFVLSITKKIFAIYRGDSQNTASASSPYSFLVADAIGGVLTASPNPVAPNKQFKLTASVIDPKVTSVLFRSVHDSYSYGVATPSGGVASVYVNSSTFNGAIEGTGPRDIYAWYTGSSGNQYSNIVSLSINGAPTTLTDTTLSLTASPNPVPLDQVVTLTAQVLGKSPSGTVSFTNGNATVGTATLSSGVATFTFNNAANLMYKGGFTGKYSGDTQNNSSRGKTPIYKTIPTIVLSSSASTVASGQNFTLTASAGGSNVTGTISFIDGTTLLQAVPLTSITASNATATLTTSLTSESVHNIIAVYSGDGTFTSKTSNAVSLTVTGAKAISNVALSTNANPVIAGQTVFLTAAVTGNTPTGTVTFMDGNTTLGTSSISAGNATFSTISFAAGTHSLTAVYAGDTNNLNSTSTATSLVVNPQTVSTTALTVAPSSVFSGQQVTLTATVNGNSPTGTVTFKEKDGTSIGRAAVSAGKAIYITASLAEGTHTITASYAGDTTNTSSVSTAVSLVVNPKTATTTTLVLAPNPVISGQAVTLTATVAGSSPTGSVSFMDGSTSLGNIAVSAGKAVLSSSTLAIGTHSISAIYPGDGGNERSTSATATLTVNDAVTTLSNYVVYGADINQDGCTDYLVRTKDGAAPVPIFTLVSSAGCQYTLTQPVPQAQSSSTAWVAAPYQLLIGDVRGDGNGSLLLVPTDKASANVFNVARGTDRKTFSLLQTIAVSKLTADPTSVNMSLSKVDADNLTDLEVTSSNGLLNVFVANTDGLLALEGSANRAASATWVWGRFITQVAAANVDASLKYVGSNSQASVRASMTQPDSNLPSFAASIKQFGILEEEQAGQVQAAVVFSSAGQDETFIVRLTKEEDGIWRIVSM